jgi:hypothetical protein
MRLQTSTCPYPEPDQSTQYPPPPYLRMRLSNNLLPPGFPTKTLHEFPFVPIHATFLAYLLILDLFTVSIFAKSTSYEAPYMHFIQTSYCFIPLVSKRSSKYPDLRYAQWKF